MRLLLPRRPLPWLLLFAIAALPAHADETALPATLATMESLADPQVLPPQGDDGTLSVVFENDFFYDIDRHYTNGVRVIRLPGRGTPAPRWAVRLARTIVPWFPDAGDVRPGYAIGHSMFTPADIRTANPPPDQRPYAGWLYGTVGLGAPTGNRLDLFTLTVGTVGPSSLAEKSQKFLHEVLNAHYPRGWGTQLGDEPGLVLTAQRNWRNGSRGTLAGRRLDLTPHAGLALGNVYTWANAGLTLRYGGSLPDDQGPPSIRPGLPGGGDFSARSDFRWYVFLAGEGRAVAHNLFLDGNTFRESHQVDKEPLVGDLQLGIVLNWHAVRVSYTHFRRSREFRTQQDEDDFGALALTVDY